MVFASIFFLFWFLPLFFAVYFLAQKQWKNIVIVVFSLLFYAWGSLDFLGLLLCSIWVNFSAGRLLGLPKKSENFRKTILGLALFFNLASLFFFKYFNFFIAEISTAFHLPLSFSHIILPLGISFFTFQNISYLVDVFRRTLKSEKNFLHYTVFSTLFPHLIAGPIVRYSTIIDEIRHRKHSIDLVFDGIRIFVLGLAMKVLIADPLGVMHNEIFTLQYPSFWTAWIGVFAYSFQIYFDFAGYSAIAIGLAKILGFSFPENFRQPYRASSIVEFWRRWHISLSQFFKDYVYIPLGGNRKWYARNILIVFLLTGIWHGAGWNFLLWGLSFGFLILGEKYMWGNFLHKIPKFFSRSIIFLMVSLLWIPFFSTSFVQTKEIFLTLFSSPFLPIVDFPVSLFSPHLWIVFAIAAILSFFHTPKFFLRLHSHFVAQSVWILFLFALCVLELLGSSFHPFLYFRF